MPITHYDAIPDLPLQKWGDCLPTPPGPPYPPDKLKWSGGVHIPAIGDVIEVTMNGLGRGKVMRYFVESHAPGDLGFLGVRVQLLDPPDWWKKQNAERLKKDPQLQAFIFGTEMKPLHKEIA